MIRKMSLIGLMVTILAYGISAHATSLDGPYPSISSCRAACEVTYGESPWMCDVACGQAGGWYYICLDGGVVVPTPNCTELEA